MTTEARRRAAVLGGVGVAMMSGAIFWRLVPVGPYASALLWTFFVPTSAFLLGLALLIRSRFIHFLAITRAERKGATERQKAELSKMTGPAIGLVSLLVSAGALMCAAPLADGRFGWGSAGLAGALYFVGLALLPLVLLLGTLLRFREIEILMRRPSAMGRNRS